MTPRAPAGRTGGGRPSRSRRGLGPARTVGTIVVGVPAFAFASLAYLDLAVPDVRPLVDENPTTTAFMDLRADEARAEGRSLVLAHTWVPLDRIDPDLQRAVLTAEDDAFWEHDGVDWKQLEEAMAVNWERKQWVRGASTVSQQLAKNLYLSPARHPLRKLRELMITRRLESVLGKRRILEIYLNVIEWGDGVFGAEAAARTYFGKSAASLTRAEAALLAGAIINPRVLNPANPSRGLRRRQQIILGRM